MACQLRFSTSTAAFVNMFILSAAIELIAKGDRSQ